MKEKLKNLMKSKLFVSSVCGVLAIIVVGTVIMLAPNRTTEPETVVSTTDAEIQSVPSIDDEDESSRKTTEAHLPSDVVVDVKEASKSDSNNKTEKAQIPVTTIKAVKPKVQSTTKIGNGGIVINGGANTAEYSCGVTKHNCDGPETHAYILNLEQEGCQYCGSNSCKSFYATDEWGNACPNAEKCPKYSNQKDPLLYCQKCKKKNGDGSNDTCVQFLHDGECPICDMKVKANTCHTCK